MQRFETFQITKHIFECNFYSTGAATDVFSAAAHTPAPSSLRGLHRLAAMRFLRVAARSARGCIDNTCSVLSNLLQHIPYALQQFCCLKLALKKFVILIIRRITISLILYYRVSCTIYIHLNNIFDILLVFSFGNWNFLVSTLKIKLSP